MKKEITKKKKLPENPKSSKRKESNNINTEEDKLSKKEQRLLKENKEKYIIKENEYRKTGKVIELLRKNKLGFYNTIGYLKNKKEETINKAILEDIKKRDTE